LTVDDNKFVEEAKQLSFVQKRLKMDQIDLEDDEIQQEGDKNKRRFPKFFDNAQKIESIDLFKDYKNKN